MYKLVSPIENGRWSFYDGYYIFKNVVWLVDENEMSKYKLIDESGNDVNVDLNDCLVEDNTIK